MLAARVQAYSFVSASSLSLSVSLSLCRPSVGWDTLSTDVSRSCCSNFAIRDSRFGPIVSMLRFAACCCSCNSKHDIFKFAAWAAEQYERLAYSQRGPMNLCLACLLHLVASLRAAATRLRVATASEASRHRFATGTSAARASKSPDAR